MCTLPGAQCHLPPSTPSLTLAPSTQVVFISGEYQKFDSFVAMWNADGKPGTVGNLRYNTIMSGLTFYLYNEVRNWPSPPSPPRFPRYLTSELPDLLAT